MIPAAFLVVLARLDPYSLTIHVTVSETCYASTCKDGLAAKILGFFSGVVKGASRSCVHAGACRRTYVPAKIFRRR